MHARELTIDELIAMKDDEFWKGAQVVMPKPSQQIRFYVDQVVRSLYMLGSQVQRMGK